MEIRALILKMTYTQSIACDCQELAVLERFVPHPAFQNPSVILAFHVPPENVEFRYHPIALELTVTSTVRAALPTCYSRLFFRGEDYRVLGCRFQISS